MMNIVAALGPKQSISMRLAQMWYPKATLQCCQDFIEIVQAVAHQRVQSGVLPWHNTSIGAIEKAQQAFIAYSSKLHIVQRQWHAFELSLATVRPGQPIHAIYSKQEAIEQCSDFLSRHFPHTPCHAMQSTAAALEKIKQLGSSSMVAAIADYPTIISYQLHCVQRQIANQINNQTLFVVIQRAPEHPLAN